MNFITFRRYYLDQMLSQSEFSGRVLDAGGKKDNKRGAFRPPLDKVESWQYLNIDEKSKPDFCCSADNIPVEAGSFDTVLLNEVLEHLENPEEVLKEICRIIKKNGVLICSIPFLFPVHADPYDFQRWTPGKIKIEIERAGFKVERIESMGGLIAVIMDLIYCYSIEPTFTNRVLRRLLRLLTPLCLHLDSRTKLKEKITTGFYVVANKTGS